MHEGEASSVKSSQNNEGGGKASWSLGTSTVANALYWATE